MRTSPYNEPKAMADLRSALVITANTRNRLPPLVSYRRGLLARLELWIKRLIKRSTYWYVWEQINFNSAVHNSLVSIQNILSTHEQRLTQIENSLKELQERTAQISDEQRVCFKQLQLQLDELAARPVEPRLK